MPLYNSHTSADGTQELTCERSLRTHWRKLSQKSEINTQQSFSERWTELCVESALYRMELA